jgi:hypothetical protein
MEFSAAKREDLKLLLEQIKDDHYFITSKKESSNLILSQT